MLWFEYCWRVDDVHTLTHRYPAESEGKNNTKSTRRKVELSILGSLTYGRWTWCRWPVVACANSQHKHHNWYQTTKSQLECLPQIPPPISDWLPCHDERCCSLVSPFFNELMRHVTQSSRFDFIFFFSSPSSLIVSWSRENEKKTRIH